MELGIVEAVNKLSNKNIYVVGFGEPDIDHPWINLGMFHYELTLDDAADFIIKYLLV